MLLSNPHYPMRPFHPQRCIHNQRVDNKSIRGEILSGLESNCRSLYGCYGFINSRGGPPCEGFVSFDDIFHERCAKKIKARNLSGMGILINDEERHCAYECGQNKECYINIKERIDFKIHFPETLGTI